MTGTVFFFLILAVLTFSSSSSESWGRGPEGSILGPAASLTRRTKGARVVTLLSFEEERSGVTPGEGDCVIYFLRELISKEKRKEGI